MLVFWQTIIFKMRHTYLKIIVLLVLFAMGYAEENQERSWMLVADASESHGWWLKDMKMRGT